MYHVNIPRSEYPRPQLVREHWMNLNGSWDFEIDNTETGRERGLPEAAALRGKIMVPFCPESKLSGVENLNFMRAVWYKRCFTIPPAWRPGPNHVILHIGACDYQTEVWINGTSAGTHSGGYASFSFDITDHLKDGDNMITICAADNVRSGLQPAGKQSSRYHSYGCFYTRTTGIWQTVWLECVPQAYISELKYTPDIHNKLLMIEAVCENADGRTLTASAAFQGRPAAYGKSTVSGKRCVIYLQISELHLWAPGKPELYDLTLRLHHDHIDSYFGMRDVSVVDGKMYINGEAVFQRLILDQGFYPEGVITAPDDNALKADIERSMAMGFNGARLHQKVFEPRFLYYCDLLGYMVWGEQGNWGLDISGNHCMQYFLPEWLEVLKRDYNHPAIIGWCPLNETQYNQNPQFVRFLLQMTKAFDSTRPVIDASGWRHEGDISDITDCHDYEQNGEIFKKHYDPLAKGESVDITPPIPNIDKVFTNKLTFMSEYGGIWWSDTAENGWGYGNRPASREEFMERFKSLTNALLDNPAFCGLCYTQLTDVEQEQNGLYTYDRKAKFDPEAIRKIVMRKAAFEEA